MAVVSAVEDACFGIVILLGQTGGGKSSIANVIMGKKLFAESCSLKSETDRLQIANGNFFGNGTPVSTIDTPGFLDSENRSANFMKDIIAIMKYFPKDKLKLVIIPLPLTETRAKQSYKTTIDEIELLLGPQFLDHTIFVTTCENQVKDPNLIQQRKNEWREWLTTHANFDASKIRMCNFIYDDPSSLSMIEDAFKQFSTFNPTTSEKMDAYMKANPHATVDSVVGDYTSLKDSLKALNDKIQREEAENNKIKASVSAAEAKNNNLQRSLRTNEQQCAQLKEEISRTIPVTTVHVYTGGGGGRRGKDCAVQ